MGRLAHPEISWKEMWLLLALLSIFQGTSALSLEASEEVEQGMASKVGEGGRDVRDRHQKLEGILAPGPKKEAAGQGVANHCFPSQQAHTYLYVYKRGLALQGTEPGLGCRAIGEPLGCVCTCVVLCTGVLVGRCKQHV